MDYTKAKGRVFLMKYFFKLKHIFVLLLIMSAFLSTPYNHAQGKLLKHNHYAKLLIQHNGKVLYSKNAKNKMYPASLTKLMTLYLTFEAIKYHKLNPKTQMFITKRASSMPSSKIWLRAGNRITVEEAIMSLIVRSANDSAVAIAENLGGSEANFVKKMNIRAKQLGMHNTNFVNASGWHHRKQVTTAYDIAKLAIAIRRDFLEYYHLFSRNSFYYKNTLFKANNYVLTNLYGAEGLKTGYTSQAGWNIVTAANRGNIRLIGVILGGKSQKSRDTEMIQLMNLYFNKHKNKASPVYASSYHTHTKFIGKTKKIHVKNTQTINPA